MYITPKRHNIVRTQKFITTLTMLYIQYNNLTNFNRSASSQDFPSTSIDYFHYLKIRF